MLDRPPNARRVLSTNGERATRPPSEFQFDEGIEYVVRLLMTNDIKTFESCEGGEGHAYPEPTVCFEEDRPGDEFRALALCMELDLPVSELRRVYRVNVMRPQELEKPHWQLVFWKRVFTPEC